MKSSKYIRFYNRAIDLYKAGNHELLPEQIFGSELYSTYESKILKRVASEVIREGYYLAVEKHPTWFNAVKSGASAEQCLRAWRYDDPDGSYLDELKYIGG